VKVETSSQRNFQPEGPALLPSPLPPTPVGETLGSASPHDCPHLEPVSIQGRPSASERPFCMSAVDFQPGILAKAQMTFAESAMKSFFLQQLERKIKGRMASL